MVTFPNRLLISLIISNIPSNISCGVQSVLFVPTNTTTALSLTLKFNSPFCILHSTFSTLKKNVKKWGRTCRKSKRVPVTADTKINAMQRTNFVGPQWRELQLLHYRVADKQNLRLASPGLLHKPLVLQTKKINKCLSKLGLISVASNWPVTTL